MIIREMQLCDTQSIIEIEKRAWDDNAATQEQIIERHKTFSNGSIVAEDSQGKVIGYAVVQLVNHISTKPWSIQTDNGRIKTTHKPLGKIVYGVNMSSLPEAAKEGDGFGANVISYCLETFLRTDNCHAICLGSRLPGYQKWKQRSHLSIDEYLKIKRGRYSRDRELRLYQKNGFQFLWKLDDYYPDPESMNYGAMIIQQ